MRTFTELRSRFQQAWAAARLEHLRTRCWHGVNGGDCHWGPVLISLNRCKHGPARVGVVLASAITVLTWARHPFGAGTATARLCIFPCVTYYLFQDFYYLAKKCLTQSIMCQHWSILFKSWMCVILSKHYKNSNTCRKTSFRTTWPRKEPI